MLPASTKKRTKRRKKAAPIANTPQPQDAIITMMSKNPSLLAKAITSQSETDVTEILNDPNNRHLLLEKFGTLQYTPLHLAIYVTSKPEYDTEIAETIVNLILDSAHTQMNAEVLCAKNASGQTPLHLALILNLTRIRDNILTSPDCTQALLIKDYRGDSPLQWTIENKREDADNMLCTTACTAQVMLVQNEQGRHAIDAYITNAQDERQLKAICNAKFKLAIQLLSGRKGHTPEQTSAIQQLVATAETTLPSLTRIIDQIHLLDLIESTQNFLSGRTSHDDYSKKILAFSELNREWAKPLLQIMAAFLFTLTAAVATACLAVSCGVTFPYAFLLKTLMVLPNTLPGHIGYGATAGVAGIGACTFGFFAKRNIDKSNVIPNACEEIQRTALMV